MENTITKLTSGFLDKWSCDQVLIEFSMKKVTDCKCSRMSEKGQLLSQLVFTAGVRQKKEERRKRGESGEERREGSE